MAQENRYPSPEPTGTGDSSHPYPSSQQQIPPDVAQHLQSAPTAMMQDSGGDSSQVPRNFEFIAQYSAQSPSTPQQMAQQGLEVNGSGPGTDPKKRNKVSRACDECRRKKVRCDAESDQPGTQCSNCKRLHMECQFSRQPQKRGPSKGYIKELADRVSRLEGPATQEMQYAMSQSLLNSEAQNQSPHVDFNTPNQRKRTHSMAETSYLSGPDQLQELSRGSAPTPNMSAAAAHAPVHALPEHARDSVQGLEPDILDGYYDYVHPIIPVLPNDPYQLAVAVEAVPTTVRQAFTAAFTIAIKTATSGVVEKDISVVGNLYLSAKPGRPDSPTDILRLQTLIFLAIAEELHSADSVHSSPWLGAAVTLANSMKLQKARSSNSEAGATLRRTFLVLVMLDRWLAAAKSGATLISDDNIHLDESDHALLGSAAYHLLRISLTLGHLTSIFLYQSSAIIEQGPIARPILTLMRGEIDRISESVQPLLDQVPAVNLALLHLQTIGEKTTEGLYANDRPVIDSALQTANLLGTEKIHATPLDHHFASLVLAILIPALRFDPKPVTEALETLRRGCENGRFTPAWAKMIGELITNELAKVSSSGLSHLADAAVGAGKENDNTERADWNQVMERGYMHIFE